MLRQGKNAEICWNKKWKATQQLKQALQLEEISQKVLAKEGRLKNTERGSNNTDKTGHSKTTKENLICK